MSTFKTLFPTAIFLLFSLALINTGCKKAEDDPSDSYTITVDAYTKSNGVYTATGNTLVFDSKEECQTWSRTAQGDAHNSAAHLHYNAAASVSYNHSDTTFSWTEFGPELDQAAIETTCAKGTNGKKKTVTTTSYYQDKPNVYLKITKVE